MAEPGVVRDPARPIGAPVTSSAALSYAVWVVLGATLLAVGLASRRGRWATPGEALARLATGPVLRIALVVGVMWAGWHLFAR
jgi:Family of unknown function (DUF6186)